MDRHCGFRAKAERRKDARVAWEYEVARQDELTKAYREDLVPGVHRRSRQPERRGGGLRLRRRLVDQLDLARGRREPVLGPNRIPPLDRRSGRLRHSGETAGTDSGADQGQWPRPLRGTKER